MIDLLSVKVQDGTVTRCRVVKVLELEFKVAAELRDNEDVFEYQCSRLRGIVSFLLSVGLVSARSAADLNKMIDNLESREE